MGNQYEADCQRLPEFANTAIDQIDSSISDTVDMMGQQRREIGS